MAVPTTYSEEELADYMHAVLGKTASIIGWSSPDSYDEAVTDAAIMAGVSDVASATDIPKLRACARLAVWQAVEADTVGYHDFSEDQQSFRMHQVHIQAVAKVKEARREAARHGVNAVEMTSVTIKRISPYDVIADSERSV